MNRSGLIQRESPANRVFRGAYRSRTGVSGVTNDPARNPWKSWYSELTWVPSGYAARRVLERAIAARDESWNCFYCGGHRTHAHIDRVTARYHGGSDSIHNLVLACRACNFDKNTQPGWFFALHKCLQPSFPSKSHGNRLGFPSDPRRHGA